MSAGPPRHGHRELPHGRCARPDGLVPVPERQFRENPRQIAADEGVHESPRVNAELLVLAAADDRHVRVESAHHGFILRSWSGVAMALRVCPTSGISRGAIASADDWPGCRRRSWFAPSKAATRSLVDSSFVCSVGPTSTPEPRAACRRSRVGWPPDAKSNDARLLTSGHGSPRMDTRDRSRRGDSRPLLHVGTR